LTTSGKGECNFDCRLFESSKTDRPLGTRLSGVRTGGKSTIASGFGCAVTIGFVTLLDITFENI